MLSNGESAVWYNIRSKYIIYGDLKMKLQTKKFLLMIPDGLHKEFKQLSYSKGISISEYLRNLMQREVDKNVEPG